MPFVKLLALFVGSGITHVREDIRRDTVKVFKLLLGHVGDQLWQFHEQVSWLVGWLVGWD